MRSSDVNRRRAAVDRAAALWVRLGGAGVVLAVLFIAAFLVAQALPLARHPELGARLLELTEGPALARGVEPFAEALWELDEDASLVLRGLADGGRELERRPLLTLDAGERLARVRVAVDQASAAIATTTGRVASVRLGFAVDYDAELRRSHRLGETTVHELFAADPRELVAFDHFQDGATAWGLAAYADGTLAIVRGRTRTNRLTGEESFRVERLEVAAGRRPLDAVLLESGAFLAAFADGSLAAWQVDRAFTAAKTRGQTPPGGEILSLQTLIGAGSALLARADGSVERWMLVTQPQGPPVLGPAAPMPGRLDGLRRLIPSARQRLFFALGRGRVALGQATAAEYLAHVELPASVVDLAVAPREDRVLLVHDDGRLELRELDLGFPAVTAHTLFGKVLYEGTQRPEWTWQSTGGSDSYEPKISFVPLILGTFKGTFWAMLPSIPLALLGALFTARFLSGRAREIVKPTVELLAGIPSVILGFVGALYLAPAIQDRMIALLILPLACAGCTVLLATAWARLPQRARRAFPEGRALLVLLGVYLALGWWILGAGPELETALLGTSLRQWVPETLGLPFEQRNAAVVGLAMGFTVTPLIFTLAEDAFRNVPETLAEASLALGATRWQTAVRVIAPPAMPGVIAAIMLGLGRAVGETMIVLMATGNTAITGMNVLQGFRALSANLATELPEAPQGESLYRTLFLSALLLFAFTFVINTFAEVLRGRGRKAL